MRFIILANFVGYDSQLSSSLLPAALSMWAPGILIACFPVTALFILPNFPTLLLEGELDDIGYNNLQIGILKRT